MKKVFSFLLCVLLVTACSDNDSNEGKVKVYDVVISIANEVADKDLLKDATITMTDANAKTFTAKTNEEGVAHISLPAGVYSVSISSIKEVENQKILLNGSISQCVVTDRGVDGSNIYSISVPITIVSQNASALIIKEIYNGGCQKNDASGSFANDKCIILYNNSAYDVEVVNLAIGMVDPYNAEATNSYITDGNLSYASADYIPLINGVWYFQDTLKVKAYEEVVVNVSGAIDNTKTYSNSINYANEKYYCMYDPTATGAGSTYNNTSWYPAPSEVIPTSHYLKAVKYGMGNAWPYSATSPATVLFQTKGISVADYAGNVEKIIYPEGKVGNAASACLSVPRSWVLDGVEIYNADKLASCKKRLTSDIDNGYVALTSKQGHVVVRKIDSVATAKAGHNVYVDTNNSSNDFEEVNQCSLRAK